MIVPMAVGRVHQLKESRERAKWAASLMLTGGNTSKGEQFPYYNHKFTNKHKELEHKLSE